MEKHAGKITLGVLFVSLGSALILAFEHTLPAVLYTTLSALTYVKRV